MSSTQIGISDYSQWGKLVKSWATGKNYFADEGFDPFPVPRTLTDVQDRCKHVGVVLTLPPSVTGLAMVEYSPEVLTIKLPPKAMVEQSETEIGNDGNPYPIPDFYDDFYATFANADPLNITDGGKRMEFHAARIGDYSVQDCG